jgi:hypothetical protein
MCDFTNKKLYLIALTLGFYPSFKKLFLDKDKKQSFFGPVSGKREDFPLSLL